jgi:hypothetical protein
MDQMISKEHRVIYETSKGNINVKDAEDMVNMHYGSKLGFGGKILTTYNYQDGKSLGLSENQIRLQVAIKADGSQIQFKRGVKYRINIKKQRKKERLDWLLKVNNVEYVVKHKSTGYSCYYFYHTCSKFLSDWMFCSKEDAAIICDELKHWDGRFNPSGNRMSEFSTSIKKDADAVQYMYNILGFRATIKTDDRVGQQMKSGYTRKNICYSVHPTDSTRLGFCGSGLVGIDIPFLRSKAGEYKYCFVVPSSALVLRRNDQIFITGNSGKSLVALSTAISSLIDPNKSFSRVYVTRPMISTSTKDFPWIKGSLIDKLRPWFAPILANLEELVGSKTELEKLIEQETICLQAIELMRGFTYKNCYVLITEAQNMTVPQAVMAITRIGENCKMVFEGDTDQKDLRGEEDGLSYLKRKLINRPDLCGMVSLDSSDILRHPLIGQILEQLDYRGLGSY